MPDSKPHPELVEVRSSKVEGQGVFAIAPIPARTRVVEYTGERLTSDEVEERDRIDRVLLFDLGNGVVLDGDPWMVAAFVNHSCDPNCHSEVIRGRLYVIADRDIAPGEEITYDYQFDPDAEIYLCACGTAKCRGTINVVRQKVKKAKQPESKVVEAHEEQKPIRPSKKQKQAA